jgi:hypothetical protein
MRDDPALAVRIKMSTHLLRYCPYFMSSPDKASQGRSKPFDSVPRQYIFDIPYDFSHNSFCSHTSHLALSPGVMDSRTPRQNDWCSLFSIVEFEIIKLSKMSFRSHKVIFLRCGLLSKICVPRRHGLTAPFPFRHARGCCDNDSGFVRDRSMT